MLRAYHYVPVFVTSVLGSFYCLFALYYMTVYTPVRWGPVMGWIVVFGVILGVNLLLAHRLAARFEVWLRTTFG